MQKLSEKSSTFKTTKYFITIEALKLLNTDHNISLKIVQIIEQKSYCTCKRAQRCRAAKVNVSIFWMKPPQINTETLCETKYNILIYTHSKLHTHTHACMNACMFAHTSPVENLQRDTTDQYLNYMGRHWCDIIHAEPKHQQKRSLTVIHIVHLGITKFKQASS